ncbi:MAG: hypothetical protein GX857_00900 [Bacteroidales bacterium]|nr:hypothetical protein [Bacteroidales bacterium]
MYIFNPENDLALANFSPHFTAPASALKMRRDLAMLPLWYALHEVLIIAEGDLNSKLLSELKEVLPINSSLISYAQIGDYPHCKVKPWGWNPSIRKELIQLGINEQLLPSLKDIELLRNYSSRQNAVKLLEELKLFNSKFCGESFCYTDINQLLSYLSRTKGDQVLKMPYSGSGKGIVWLKGAITDKQTDWCRRVIKMQGGVVVEPALNKVQDFAMEFDMTNSDIQFLGYSLFRSAPSGAYLGNVLLSDEEIENKLSTYIERSQLLELKDILKAKLSNCFPSYRGYFGVDMMVCKTDEAFYQIQPCVEVNMRMNMGIVAHRINERFVYPKSTGLFSINFYKKEGEAQSNSLTMQAEHPLVIKDGKIKRGYLSLTPVDEHTQYTATIAIKEKSRKE